ncbi:hypothetical protein DL96DRAFT_1573385 [Flagelloscypha sp. PMI_526]|nr:hypothetical protein DL96DRAFT_1573385 [Flagelloscypha sp. PMI_526]
MVFLAQKVSLMGRKDILSVMKPLTPLDLGFDVWLFILTFLGISDVLRLRQVSKLFYGITKQISLWITFYYRTQPSRMLSSTSSIDSIERFFKFRQNWTSPLPVPVETPITLPESIRPSKIDCPHNVDAVKFVKDECGESWLVVINDLGIYEPPPAAFDPEWDFGACVQYVYVEAFLVSDIKKRWAFGKWYTRGAKYQYSDTRSSWSFNEDEETPCTLTLACADGLIHTYSLTSKTGWSCSRSTILPTAPENISFLSSSGDSAIVALGPGEDAFFALIDLRGSGTVSYLLTEDGIRLSANDGSSARFSRNHVVVFHYASTEKELIGNIYSLHPTTQSQIRPIAQQRFPAGTKSILFPHITTEKLAFTILLTSLLTPKEANMQIIRRSRHPVNPLLLNDRKAKYTVFSFAFSPLTLNATLDKQNSVPDQEVYHFNSTPMLSKSGRSLLHWSYMREVRCEHLGHGDYGKSSIVLDRLDNVRPCGPNGFDTVVDVDDEEGWLVWWDRNCPVTLMKYGC